MLIASPLWVKLKVLIHRIGSDFTTGWAVSTFLEFIIDSKRLLQRCTKPDAREFRKIASACAIGFAIMGFIG